MALTILDGLGASKTLATGLSGSDLVPFHAISGSVNVIGTALTASIANSSLVVTASQANPVYVTGAASVTVLNYSLQVTSSKGEPLFVISDTEKPVVVANTVNTPLFVTSSATYPFYVTSSVPLTVAISGAASAVELTGSSVKQMTGSSTNTYLQVSIAPVASGSARRRFAPAGYTGPQFGIDSTFDWSSAASGTVCLASASFYRKTLTIVNPTADSLFISIGADSWLTGTNGLAINSTASAATEYSFILYSSGTYFAEPHNVGMFHGGYMISGSSSGNRIFVTETY